MYVIYFEIHKRDGLTDGGIMRGLDGEVCRCG